MSDPGSTSMVPNSLTRNAGLRLRPIFFETLFRHYLAKDEDAVPLRMDELLYDEVFNIVRVRIQSYTLWTPSLTLMLHSSHSSRKPRPGVTTLILCIVQTSDPEM